MWVLNVTIETPLQANISGLEQNQKNVFPCCANEEVIILHGRILSTEVDETPYVEDGRNWESVTEFMSHIDSNSLCSRLLTIKHIICGLRCLRYGGLRYGGYIYIYKYIYWYVDVSAQRNNRDPTAGEDLGVGAEDEESIPLLYKRRSDHPARPHSFDWSGWSPIRGRRSELGVCGRAHVSYGFEQPLQQTPHHKRLRNIYRNRHNDHSVKIQTWRKSCITMDPTALSSCSCSFDSGSLITAICVY